MQRVDIIGHLGQDAEVKDFQNNQVINFSVAVTESYINKTTGEKMQNTTWFECAKWGNQTHIAQYLNKGQLVYVTGKPKARAWQKQDGTTVASLGIDVFEIKLLGSAKSENQGTSQPHHSNHPTNTPPANQGNPQPPTNEEEHDDLPF